MNHTEWVSWLTSHEEWFRRALAESTKERRGIGARLAPMPDIHPCERIDPLGFTSPQWRHLRAGFFGFVISNDVRAVVFVASIGFSTWGLLLRPTLLPGQYMLSLSEDITVQVQPIDVLLRMAGVSETPEPEVYSLDWEPVKFEPGLVTVRLDKGAELVDRPIGTRQHKDQHEDDACEFPEAADGTAEHVKPYFDPQPSDLSSVCSSEESAFSDDDDDAEHDVTDVSEASGASLESSDEETLLGSGRAAKNTYTVYSNGYFTIQNHPKWQNDFWETPT
eukprot:8532345-Karenia_brevis.AAC.2